MFKRLVLVVVLVAVCSLSWAQNKQGATDFYGDLQLRDNIPLMFGTDDDFEIDFDSATSSIKVKDPTANELFQFIDAGTTGNFNLTGQYQVGGAQIDSDDLSDTASIAMLDEAETIAANWVNEANPWADNEVSNTLQSSLFVGSGSTTNAIDLATAEVAGTLAVPNGGTGATTFVSGGILVGVGASSLITLGVATNGQIPIGDGVTFPTMATITGTTNQIAVTNGVGTITLSTPQDIHTGASPTFVAGTFTGNVSVLDLDVKGGNLSNSSGTELQIDEILRVEETNVANLHTTIDAHMTAVFEGTKSSIQIAASDLGAVASYLFLTNAPGAGNNKHWVFHHKGVSNSDELSISYVTSAADNESIGFSSTTAPGLTMQTNGDGSISGVFAVVGNEVDLGDAGGFSGPKYNPATTEYEFWIDGSVVGHVGTDGAYVDDVP